MIQVWHVAYDEETDTTGSRLAHFGADGVVRFAPFVGDYTASEARLVLLDSPEAKAGIRPKVDADIVWHDDDRSTIVDFMHHRVDSIKWTHLLNAVFPNGDPLTSLFQCVVYVLKFLELMSGQLALRSLSDAVILGHEAGPDTLDQQKLAAVWAEKSDAWLALVGIAEAAAGQTKTLISEAKDLSEMESLLDSFPQAISEALAAK